MPTKTATPRTMPAVVSAVRSTWRRKYGQLISRSRIILPSGLTAGAADVFDDAAVAQGDGALAALRHGHVVRDDDDRRAEAGVQVADQRKNLLAGARVEVAGRFVGEQDRRIDRQRARDRDALPLAAGELVGQMMQAVFELDQREQLARAFVDLLPRPAAQVQRQPHVLQRAQRRQQVEELEDEADLVAADAGQLVVAEAGERLAVDAHLAGGRAIEPADQVQQRRFAGARRSNDRDHLAARDGEGDAVERDDVAFAAELARDLVELDDRRRRGG